MMLMKSTLGRLAAWARTVVVRRKANESAVGNVLGIMMLSEC